MRGAEKESSEKKGPKVRTPKETTHPHTQGVALSRGKKPLEKHPTGALPPHTSTHRKEDETRAHPRGDLPQEELRLLRLRKEIAQRRPRFVRTQAHRYWRIGRWDSWRAPRGLQSKQRRHYGYRPTVVSIGFRGPAAVRGRVGRGLAPVLVHTVREMEGLLPEKNVAVIAHGVGTKKRLILEEAARKKGLRLANPLSHHKGEKS